MSLNATCLVHVVGVASQCNFRRFEHLVTMLPLSLSRRMSTRARTTCSRALRGSAAVAAGPWLRAPLLLSQSLGFRRRCCRSLAQDLGSVLCFAAAALFCCSLPHVLCTVHVYSHVWGVESLRALPQVSCAVVASWLGSSHVSAHSFGLLPCPVGLRCWRLRCQCSCSLAAARLPWFRA